MRVKPVLGILVVVGFVVAAEAQVRKIRRAGPPPPEKVELRSREAVVPMALHVNRPVIELMLNGRGPFRFLLDTGAMGSVISDGLVDELDLPVLGEALVGSPAGGKPVPGRRIRIDRIAMGDVVIHGAEAVAMDLGILRGQVPPAGVLSASVFEGLLLTLDYPQQRVVVREGELPEADGAEVLQYGASARLPSIEISVAGTAIRAHLDSGSQGGLMLPAKYIDELPLASKPVQIGRARLVDTEMTVLGAALEGELKIGRFGFQDPEIRFSEAIPTANVGYEILGGFAVTLDRKNRRIRLEKPSRAASEPAEASLEE